MERGRFLLAVAAAAVLILAAPFIGRIRNLLRDLLSEHYVLVLAIAVGGCVVAAISAALLRIRDRRLLRYSLIAAAVTIGAAYSFLTSSPEPQVAAVERFHFVQYGLITFLFYRAWRPLGDAGLLILPVLAAMLTATVEEWFQWFIPGRVGVVEDVFLNWVAIGCGVLFSIGFDPPSRRILALGPRARRHCALTAALFVTVFGFFFDAVHLGYRIDDPRIGSFVSIFTADDLHAHARDRALRWQRDPPIDRTRLAREDQYRTEGIQRVQARNEAWDRGDVAAAWCENLILETYYAPVLERGHAWPAEQRRDAATRAQAGEGGPPFESAAYPYRVYTWRSDVFWAAVLSTVAALLALSRRARRPPAPKLTRNAVNREP